MGSAVWSGHRHLMADMKRVCLLAEAYNVPGSDLYG